AADVDEEAEEEAGADTEQAVEAASIPGDIESPEELLTTIADTATAAREAADEAKAAAEQAQTAVQQGEVGADRTGASGEDGADRTGAPGEDGADQAPATGPHTISLDVDIDADDLEAIVQGLKNALAKAED
ncbi:MAG: hypothetical protein ABEH90_10600, partial [Halolamina sp.]